MKLQPVTSHQKKMRGLGGSQTYYYLQLLLTGDTETGRKSRTFSMAGPLRVIARKIILPTLLIFKNAFCLTVRQSLPV